MCCSKLWTASPYCRDHGTTWHGWIHRSGCCRSSAKACAERAAPNLLAEHFSQHFVTILTHANLILLPVAFQSSLPAGCFIFNTCSTLELSHRFLQSLVTTPVVLFLPGAEKCQHSTENFNVPTVQLYLPKSLLRHRASAWSVLSWLYISLFTAHAF